MRPDATGVSAALPGGPQISDNGLYFNPAAFIANAGVPVRQRQPLPARREQSDRLRNWMLLIEKNTRFAERFHLTFRAELFNASNHVVFSGPMTSASLQRQFGHIF